jgi:hypothetical protein
LKRSAVSPAVTVSNAMAVMQPAPKMPLPSWAPAIATGMNMIYVQAVPFVSNNVLAMLLKWLLKRENN